MNILVSCMNALLCTVYGVPAFSVLGAENAEVNARNMYS